MCASVEGLGEKEMKNDSQQPHPLWTELTYKPTCCAIFSFRGSEIIPNYGLDLDLGDTLTIIEQCGEWYRGYSTTRRNKLGIFPVSYVKLKVNTPQLQLQQRPSSASVQSLPTTGTITTDQTAEKSEDNVVKEIALVAREWGEIWKRLYVEGETSYYQWEVIGRGIRELIEGRRQLITGTLTQDQLREIKLRLTAKIDWGNRRLGLDLVPRIGYEVVNPDNFGAVQLYHIHIKSVENAEAARGTVRKKRKSIFPSHKAIGHHLYLSVRDFPIVVSDDTEVYFSLYDAQRSQYITERFMVKFSREGMSNFVDKVQSQSVTIFEDLGYADLTKDLFLVAHVIRIGKMFHSETTKKSTQLYKRSYAGGILNIGEVVSQALVPMESLDDGGTETTLKLAEPTTLLELEAEKEFSFKIYSCDEKDFSQLHDFLIKKQMGKVSLITVSGQPLQAIVALKMFHGDLSSVRTENPTLLKNTVGTRKLGFPDVIMPGDVRNDMYITLDHGEFEKSGKNIEVTVLVLDSSGRILQGSVYGAVSSTGKGADQYQSVILHHTNTPKWGETIRLTIPIETFPACHVRLEYRHCSTKEKNDKKLYGFSFAKLMDEEGTTLKDGFHDLYIYKCEDKGKLKDPLNYLNLPSSASNSMGGVVLGNQTFQRSSKEIMVASTFLVSTKLTQNMDLVSLLKWKSHPEKMIKTLKSIAQLSGEEIVKFLQDVLDVLFSMFLSEEGESNEFSGDVFIVLINIFSILEDVKFEHFKPVIEAYITDHFAAALVYKGLLCTVRHYAEVVQLADKEFHVQIQKCFETLEFIFKFIIQSHILFTRATGGEINDSFSKDVFDLFKSLNKMFSDCEESTADTQTQDIIPIQAALMYNLSKMYTELQRILPAIEVTHLVVECLGSIQLKESAHLLSPSKLTALHHLVRSPLFADRESRGIILPEVCKHLRHHFRGREELKLCTDVLGDIVTFLYAHSKQMDNRIHDDIETVATTTLEKLVQSILVLERTSSVVGNLVSCLMGLLQLMDQNHYNRLWDEFCERKLLHDVIQRILLVFRDLIKQDVFPKDWIIMKLLTDSIMLKSMNELSQPLSLYFLNKCWFDSQLWNYYFTLAVTFLTQPTLQLENFRETKKDSILERYGDMRVQMGSIILTMWSNLGEHKISFIPFLVGPFLEVTLIPQVQLRKATLDIFYDMIEVEQTHKGNFKQLECELIDKLDLLVSKNKGDDEYRQLFNSVLSEKLKNCNQPWQNSGTLFVNAVTRLLERLLDYRNVLQGDENRDKRMSCTVNLLEFYKTEINRREMYLRYIYKLHDLHCSAENFTEAGFTLLLHTEMLDWSNENLQADGYTQYTQYPIQTEMERKEMIYLKVIQYFNQGKVWEKGIPLCKELCQLYETKSYEYEKLSKLLMTQAKFFENIMNQLRPDPEYFRVGFFGRTFPLFVRNKEFIYRGLEYEKIGTFMQRVLTEWPTAQILNNNPPDDSILSSDEQYIQICCVKPIADPNNPVLGAHVQEKIQSYYEVNNVATFQFDRRLHKFVHDDPDNEFKNMWVERTTMTTSAPLPGILRWFDVISKKVEELTPVRFACEKMEDVNKELSSLIAQYLTETQRNVNPLSMRLSGVLDAAVMGGIPKYRDAFFRSEFLQNNPDATMHVAKLRTLILEQVTILENGLSVHGRFAPSGVQPLHKRLLECFTTMKETVQADFSNYSPSSTSKSTTNLKRSESQRDSFRKNVSLSSIVNTPLPPVPVGVKKLTIESSTSNRSSNSSGYGHLINSLFDSDDEDVYSKPGDVKIALSTPPSSLQSFSANQSDDNLHFVNNANVTDPPPIPNRTSKRHTTLKVQQHLSASPSLHKSTEYILMPPSRVRELCDERNSHDSPVRQRSLSDSFHTAEGSPASLNGTNLSNNNETYATITSNNNGNATPPSSYYGPPLPPKFSLTEKIRAFSLGTDNPPVLPRRQPKQNQLLLQSNSFSINSEIPSGSSTPPSPSKGYANDCNKTPPPVPPKPNRSTGSSTTSVQLNQDEDSVLQTETPYMNKNELNNSIPSSPSYEERFENTSLPPTSEDTTESNNVKVDENDDKLPEIKNIKLTNVERSPSSMSQRRSHKEYYTLPLRNTKTGTKDQLPPEDTE